MADDALVQKIETGDSVKVKQVLDEALLETVSFHSCLPCLNDFVHQLEQDNIKINYRDMNIKLAIMFFSCVFAMIAQFYPLPFPENRIILGVCCGRFERY
jgi:signal peptidase complex subunit 2